MEGNVFIATGFDCDRYIGEPHIQPNPGAVVQTLFQSDIIKQVSHALPKWHGTCSTVRALTEDRLHTRTYLPNPDGFHFGMIGSKVTAINMVDWLVLPCL